MEDTENKEEPMVIPAYYKKMLKEALELYKEKHHGPWEQQENGLYWYSDTKETKRVDWLVRNIIK